MTRKLLVILAIVSLMALFAPIKAIADGMFNAGGIFNKGSVASGGSPNLDGGTPTTNYGATTPIDGGTP